MPINTSLSLYLHIPFCRHRCAYCDFNTYTSLSDLQADYAAALAAEIHQVGGQEKRATHTIFFGGGTPSLMQPSQLALILDAVQTNFDLTPAAEVTMEANPETVDLAYLRAVRSLGVNRISFGVQSAMASELNFLEREHSFDTAVAAVELARQAGIDNINIDLIYGVPGQTLKSWQESVAAVVALSPSHLSLYCLTIEPGTPMRRWLESGRISPPDPDLAADQYEFACEHLALAGFDHYEISNWALPEQACAHNLTYWQNEEYLGLGAGAHGHAAGFRYEVVKQPRVYVRRLSAKPSPGYPLSAAAASWHQLSRQEAMSDTIITQLRLLHQGLNRAAFVQRFGQTVEAVYGPVIEQLVEWDLLSMNRESIKLTRKGWFLSNQVFYRFM